MSVARETVSVSSLQGPRNQSQTQPSLYQILTLVYILCYLKSNIYIILSRKLTTYKTNGVPDDL